MSTSFGLRTMSVFGSVSLFELTVFEIDVIIVVEAFEAEELDGGLVEIGVVGLGCSVVLGKAGLVSVTVGLGILLTSPESKYFFWTSGFKLVFFGKASLPWNQSEVSSPGSKTL